MVYWVYILRCADNTLYSGSTPRLEKRILEHNEGKGAKYTRGRRPVSLLQAWVVETRSQALQLEAFLKRFSRQEKEKFIAEPILLPIKAEQQGYMFKIRVDAESNSL
jgi:putative endonuclease